MKRKIVSYLLLTLFSFSVLGDLHVFEHDEFESECEFCKVIFDLHQDQEFTFSGELFIADPICEILFIEKDFCSYNENLTLFQNAVLNKAPPSV